MAEYKKVGFEQKKAAEQLKAERDRLANDALAALSGAGIPTPEKGYVAEPHMLALDIIRLAKERDQARKELSELALKHGGRNAGHGFGPVNCTTCGVLANHYYFVWKSQLCRDCWEKFPSVSEVTPMLRKLQELKKLDPIREALEFYGEVGNYIPYRVFRGSTHEWTIEPTRVDQEGGKLAREALATLERPERKKE